MKPYYEHGGISIYHGDCREVLPTLSLTGVACVTDPPYPGYAKGWEIPDVASILASVNAASWVVCWPVLTPSPLPVDAVAEHVWEKPNGRSLYHYERILCGGEVPRGAKVLRIAVILPNYVQFRHEAEDHPTQKPLKLMRKLIGWAGGDPVLDPFMGSGTTLRAAKDLGRRAIGIEIEERYCEIAAKRLAQETLFGVTA